MSLKTKFLESLHSQYLSYELSSLSLALQTYTVPASRDSCPTTKCLKALSTLTSTSPVSSAIISWTFPARQVRVIVAYLSPIFSGSRFSVRNIKKDLMFSGVTGHACVTGNLDMPSRTISTASLPRPTSSSTTPREYMSCILEWGQQGEPQ